ncbi:MAG: hypothetical protein M1836_003158 [Candelina mexicana]|nr:MAG: hypothetical protein M1836_003158 [Candelina mexicana]
MPKMSNPLTSISQTKGYSEKPCTFYPVLIVGAGESGIAMGCRLKEIVIRLDNKEIRWINRYPGVKCDIPAVFYSFSFSPNNQWTTFHPTGPEIVKYLQDVCEKYQIVDKIQLNTDVTEIKWLEDQEEWEVSLAHIAVGAGDLSEAKRQEKIREHGLESVQIGQEVVRAKIVASAVGGLVEPRAWPMNVPGKENFEGDIFHSARWDYGVKLAGKDVIVVGTGCSAAQFVPELTKTPFNAKSVTQIMRSPPWVAPRPVPPFGQAMWEKWSPSVLTAMPWLARLMRLLIFLGAERDLNLFGQEEYHAKFRSKVEKDLLVHLRRSVPEKYHEILTPDYPLGCKRRIFDATWFPGLNDPKIELTTLPLTSVQPRGVTLGPGRTYPDMAEVDSSAPKHEVKLAADAIILANGFDTTTWLHTLKVKGKDGKYLHDVWDSRGGPQAYLGAAMDGFPNFFIVFGPNTVTGHSSVIVASENMVNYSLKFMKLILNGDASTCEVKKEAEMKWTREVQEKLKKTIWHAECQNWYTSNGWNAVLYP